MSKETDAVTEMNQRFELMSILDQLNADERAVVLGSALMVARRMLSGRQRYAPLDLSTDVRDWLTEAAEEACDGLAYAVAAQVQRSRRG